MLSSRVGGKPRWKLFSHRIGIALILLSFLWGLYLIKIQLDERRNRSHYLKEQIIELSKQYVHALAKEKSLNTIDGQQSAEVADLKRATAVLLQSMLDRIQHLEKQVEVVIMNSTAEFATLSKQIRYLNTSMVRRWNVSHTDWANDCVVRDDPNYPECQKQVKWLTENWKSDPKYGQMGVNGSKCSVIYYLSEVEHYCPKAVSAQCTVPNDPGYPHCQEKVKWMQKFWKSDNKYSINGVDGSDCSFIIFLSEVETWCPMLPGRIKSNDCPIPADPAYPACQEKIAWMRKFWKSDPCYANDHGVNGTVCSFISYLSVVEHWCPPLEGMSQKSTQPSVTNTALKPVRNRHNVNRLLNLLSDKNPMKFKWMRSRVFAMWPKWQDALKKINFTNTVRKKILVHIGLLAKESVLHFGELAYKGGPLGELVQWSDLITSLYLLGHDVTVTADIVDMASVLGASGVSPKKNCPVVLQNTFDLVYLDYYGLKQIMSRIGNLMPRYKCKLRVVDSFGTEAQFNYAGYKDKIGGGSMGIWGRHNLNLRQYMTMFPHSPDNTFLGFVVGSRIPKNVTAPKKKKVALVYGKHYYMWKDLKSKSYLSLINQYTQIHATVGGLPEHKLSEYIPSFVKNHGVLKSEDLQTLLKESLVFVGLGFPYEGPAALEAIANGCYFINPKFTPAKNRLNEKFFKDKPTLRLLSSQHPYAEEFIGKPYVYTVDINNEEEIKRVMKKIVAQKPLKPHLPLEYTHEGMLERLSATVQNQDFCDSRRVWPPISNLVTKTDKLGVSCKEICRNEGLVCEPEFFPLINTLSQLTRNGFPCNSTQAEFIPSLVAPGFRTEPPACLIQTQTLLFSCTAASDTTRRLCPCREFKKEQVQLCKTC